jgi:hypothetical protein
LSEAKGGVIPQIGEAVHGTKNTFALEMELPQIRPVYPNQNKLQKSCS